MSSAFTNIILLLISVVFIIGGGYYIGKHRRLKRTGKHAEGIVHQYVSDTAGNRTTYYPVIRFVTHSNEWITEKNPISGYYLPGKRVDVYYNPDNPKEFMIDTLQNKMIPIVILVIGSVLLLFTLGSLLLPNHLFLFT